MILDYILGIEIGINWDKASIASAHNIKIFMECYASFEASLNCTIIARSSLISCLCLLFGI
jgi:hypothetical protein